MRRAIALVVAVVLHVLLLAPALSGGTVRAPARSVAPALAWIELRDTRATTQVGIQPDVHLQRLKLQVVDVTAGNDIPDAPAENAVPEYVRRMAALTARIQGLWKLPRARLVSDFRCRARLHTGESGSVEEVELENCDASGPVRASIAQAIEHSMPLPLPQERSGDIVLQFIAYAEVNGASHTSIEPAADGSSPD